MTDMLKSELLGECVKTARLPSGLTVLCCERPNRVGVFATLSARIGSLTGSFMLDGRQYTLPSGTAHFLEHKLFSGKKGDAFELFAKSGAAANAYTSLERTSFVFSANSAPLEALRTLLQFVSSPHFTHRGVKKERGIIEQEIDLYRDSDYWQLQLGALSLAYGDSPIADDIAGTAESINQIDKRLLQNAYRAFYRPDNMVLAVAGNITLDSAVEAAARFFTIPALRFTVKAQRPDMRKDIAASYGEKRMAVADTQACICYRERPFVKNRLRNELLLDIILDTVFGSATDWFRAAYEEGLINPSFSSDVYSGEDYLCVMLSGETDDPPRLLRSIEDELQRIKLSGIDQARFVEALNAHIGDEILSLESNEDISTGMAAAHFEGRSIFDALTELKSITAEEVNSLLKTLFTESNAAVFAIKPNERD